MARSLRAARRRRLNGAMYEFGCCRVPSRAAACCRVQPCVAGAWLMVARVCYSSVSILNSLTRPNIDTHHRAAAEVAQKGRGEAV